MVPAASEGDGMTSALLFGISLGILIAVPLLVKITIWFIMGVP